MMFRKISICTVLVAALVGCGGGGVDSGSDNGGEGPPLLPGATILTVSGDALYRSAPVSSNTSLVQNSTSGYATTSSIVVEWSGVGLRYTSGYTLPTSGALRSISVQFRSGSQVGVSIRNADYNISNTSPSLDYSDLIAATFRSAVETRVFGSDGNDKASFLSSTSEVDLGRGDDTLILFENYSAFRFQSVSGQQNQVAISRAGATTVVKNVEFFEFPSETISFTTLLQRISN
jgi:hypothetical protein